MERNRVFFQGFVSNHCGYCNESDERNSINITADKLTVEFYDALLDKGWRRSGIQYYKPDNEKSCCPNYPIVCNALEFDFTKSFRTCVEQMNSYLENGSINMTNSSSILYTKSLTVNPSHKLKSKQIENCINSRKARNLRFMESCKHKAKKYSLPVEEAAKLVNARHEKMRMMRSSLEESLYPTKSKMNVEFKPMHKLRIELNSVDSQRCKDLFDSEHKILVNYQIAIHNDEGSEWKKDNFKHFLCSEPFYEKPIEHFNLTKDIHNSSLLVQPPSLPSNYGSYHCHYFLDEELIGVGVIDVLPSCLTSVYFFYDPKYKFLNLGLYSGLVEASIVRRLNFCFIGSESQNSLTRYNLGFLVYECPKMHYKLRFRPSSLLCSETNTYVDQEKCLDKLKIAKYARFADQSVENVKQVSINDVMNIHLYIENPEDTFTLESYLVYCAGHNISARLQDQIVLCYCEFANSIGLELLSQIVIQVGYFHLCVRNKLAELPRVLLGYKQFQNTS